MAGLTSLIARRPRLTLAAAVGLGLLAAALLQRLPPPAQQLQMTPVFRTVLEDPGSPAVGLADADVAVVVFTDYQCAVCKRTDPALRRLLANDPGVRLVFKDWPVFGERSRAAARAALAAERQGRYLELHAALMDVRGPLDAERIRQAALAAGVDWARLQADLAAHGPALDRQLARHQLQAFSLGLAGTPAYLVGPYLMQGGLDDAQLAKAVDRVRRSR